MSAITQFYNAARQIESNQAALIKEYESTKNTDKINNFKSQIKHYKQQRKQYS